MQYFQENGLTANMYECASSCAAEPSWMPMVKVFRTLNDYVSQHSGFANLTLDNFRTIFLLHFSICFLVFIAFSMHHLVKFVKSRVLFFQWLWFEIRNLRFRLVY